MFAKSSEGHDEMKKYDSLCVWRC